MPAVSAAFKAYKKMSAKKQQDKIRFSWCGLIKKLHGPCSLMVPFLECLNLENQAKHGPVTWVTDVKVSY